MSTNHMSTVYGALATTSVQTFISILALSSGLSLFTAAHKRALNPLFESNSIEQYLGHVVHCSTALGIFIPKLPASRALLILAMLLLTSSHCTYWTSVFAARYCGPVVGPLVPHTLVLAPVTSLSVSLMMHINVRYLLFPDSPRKNYSFPVSHGRDGSCAQRFATTAGQRYARS